MTKNRNVIMGAIPMVVASIAAGADVRVVWGNFQTASTNGKVVNMPFLPLEDEKVEAYALGFAVHETGHIVGTEFGLPMGTGLRAALVNILEDVRIEGERMATLPGARRWLEDLAYVLLRDGKLGVSKEEWGVAEKLCSYLLTYLWVEILQFKGLNEAATHCRDVLAKALPPELFAQVEEKALRVKAAQSTRKVMEIADSVMALLQEQKQAAQEQAKQQQSAHDQTAESQHGSGEPEPGEAPEGASADAGDGSEGDGEEDPDDNAGEGEGEGGGGSGNTPGVDAEEGAEDQAGGQFLSTQADDGAQAADSQGDSGGSQSAAAGEDGDPTAASQAGGHQAGQDSEAASGALGDGTVDGSTLQAAAVTASNGMSAQEVADALQEMLDAQEVEAGKDIGERIVEGLSQSLDPANRLAGTQQASIPMGAPEVAEMRSAVGSSALIGQVRLQSMALRARLDEYVQAQTRRRSSVTRSGSRMVRNAASRLAMKDYRIYSVERSEVKKVDTAFALLVDCSGSMSGAPISVARQAAVALAVALEEIKGTQLSVIGFGTTEAPITRVMRFGESIRKAAERIDTLQAMGSTPLAEGLLVAHTDLLNLQAERRIVMVVTDGEPDDSQAVIEIAKFGRKHGIEHMGIGIRQRTDHLFPASCFINQVGELPRAVLDMVHRVLFDNWLAA